MARKCANCHRGRATVMVEGKTEGIRYYVCLRCLGLLIGDAEAGEEGDYTLADAAAEDDAHG